MIPRRIFFRLPFRLAALLALLAPLCTAFAESRVRGILSTHTASVGEALEYELTIEGGETPDNLPAPSVDGIEVRGSRQNRQLSIVNGNVTNRTIVTYTLVPKREGKFTIPPLEVNLGGRVLKTLPAELTITPGETMNEAGDFAFAKIVLPKQTLYLGEVAPMEVRYYLDTSARWELRSAPTLEGDGFTMRPLGKPTERNVQLSGKTYDLVTYNTMITPGKAGKLSLGPVPVNLVVSKPSRSQPRFDPFGQGFGFGTGPAQEMTVSAPALEVLVKPLPAAGKPKDFSGAIGKFEFDATGTPARVKIGEPLNVKLTVSGSGNFDRIGQPPLAEPDGWTAYASKDDFKATDAMGTQGAKTFELPVTPTAKKTTMPVFTFSFFDPEAAKYVTLRSAASPLKVEGEPAAAPVKAGVAENAAAKTGPDNDEPKAPAVQDILPNLPELGALAGGYGLRTPPLTLFSVMFAPLPVLLALLAWRSRKVDAGAQRAAAARREKSALLACVRKSSDRTEVLDAAVRVLQIDSAADGAQPATGGELAQVLAARKLDDSAQRAVRDLFEARNELLYAGGSRGNELGETERDRLLDTLATYERSAAE